MKSKTLQGFYDAQKWTMKEGERWKKR